MAAGRGERAGGGGGAEETTLVHAEWVDCVPSHLEEEGAHVGSKKGAGGAGGDPESSGRSTHPSLSAASLSRSLSLVVAGGGQNVCRKVPTEIEKETCCVCLAKINLNTEKTYMQLPCNHEFHTKCLESWIPFHLHKVNEEKDNLGRTQYKEAVSEKLKTICPLCRGGGTAFKQQWAEEIRFNCAGERVSIKSFQRDEERRIEGRNKAIMQLKKKRGLHIGRVVQMMFTKNVTDERFTGIINGYTGSGKLEIDFDDGERWPIDPQ